MGVNLVSLPLPRRDGGVDLGGETLFNLKVGACREAGFFMRYYWRPTDRLQFFPDVGYSFSKNIYPGFYSSRTRTFEGGLGANVWINNRFALETLLQYRRHRFYMENNEPAPVRQNSLGLEMSLVYFVFPKKAGV